MRSSAPKKSFETLLFLTELVLLVCGVGFSNQLAAADVCPPTTNVKDMYYPDGYGVNGCGLWGNWSGGPILSELRNTKLGAAQVGYDTIISLATGCTFPSLMSMATSNPNVYMGYATDGIYNYPFSIAVNSWTYGPCQLANYHNVDGMYCAADAPSDVCPDALTDNGKPDYCPVADPISHATGNSTRDEADFVGGGAFPLVFRRYYNSAFAVPGSALRYGWRHSFEKRIEPLFNTDGSADTAYLLREDGKILKFTKTGSTPWQPSVSTTLRFFDVVSNGVHSGWQVVDENDIQELYTQDGVLVSLVNRQGIAQSMTYVGGSLSEVQHSFGRSLRFESVRGFGSLTLKVNLPSDDAISVSLYDQVVTFPDNSKIQYLNDEPELTSPARTRSGFLTGIIDGSGQRITSYAYDALGRAVSNELPGGLDKYSIDYSAADGSRAITDPLGTVRVDRFTTVNGIAKFAGRSQPGGSGCGASLSSVTYDANGNVKTSSDFNGNTTNYTYDLSRNLETQRIEAFGKPEARTISTDWHAYWRLPTKLAEPKKLTTWTYNGDNGVYCAPTAATVPNINGGTQPIGVLCSQTEQATTDLTGSAGFSATTTGSPRTWTYTYDQNGQVLTANGPRTDVADITTYTYYTDTTATHALGDLASVMNALNHLTQVAAYDKNGRPLAITDPNNNPITLSYSPRGWLQTSSIAGQTTIYDYDVFGNLTKLTRPDGSYTEYHYDDARRLMSINNTQGDSIKYQRDNAGNITQTDWVNPDTSHARSQRFAYDALGRLQNLIETRNGINAITTFGYDANGNRTTKNDPKTQVSTTTWDGLDRAKTLKDALNGLTQLVYDGQDRTSQVTAPNGASTGLTVDGLGNITSENSADRGMQIATYDEAGNLKTLKDARNLQSGASYDVLNRPLTVTYPTTGENVSYTWDTASGCTNGIGRLCQVTDSTGSVKYAYDARGNLTSETRTVGSLSFTTTYSYDAADRLKTLIAPSGKVVTANLDADGHITQVSTTVSGSNVNLVQAVQTDAAGNTTAQTFGDGTQENRTYGADGSPISLTETAISAGSENADVPTLPEWGAILLGGLLMGIGLRRQRHSERSATFASTSAAFLFVGLLGLWSLAMPAQADETLIYDQNGNVIQRVGATGTTTYGYDALDRLNSEAGPSKTQTLGYDANGNRTSDASGTHTYTANTDRQLTIAGQTVTLDAAGNMTQARNLGFIWNQAGQLKEVHQGSPSGTLLASYDYDAFGRRIKKTTTASAPQGAMVRIYLYDRYDRLLMEADGSGNPLITYVWRDQVPISLILHGTQESALYLETDHLNTPRAARNQNKTVVWRWESDAFGTTLPNEDPDGDSKKTTINLRFPGQYFDAESGLHYNLNRYYFPQLGRYISSDPIGLAGGVNTFGYVGGNPLSVVDPMGLWSVTFGAYLGAGGQITFGNDGGNGYMTGRVGLGLGGGISYTPDGGIPGPVPKDPSAGGVVLSCSAKGNFNAGPLTAYLEKGVARNYSNAESAIYGGAGYSGRDRAWGLNASGSVGGQITIYSGKK